MNGTEAVLDLEGPSDVVEQAAPAKLNLALHVVGRRADGYHLLESLVVFTRFGDRIRVAPAEEDAFSISGRYAGGLSADPSNLVLKARDSLRAHAGSAKALPVAITLEKNLPIASGVGGGSSDAAATLRALSSLWSLGADETELARIGLPLGADVPMCLTAKPLIASGIGENIAPVRGFPELGLVLVNPGVALSTPQVFAALHSRENPGLPPLPRRLDFHSLWTWLESTRNDLQPPAMSIEPAVGHVLQSLKKAGAAFARMSGSGATCFGIFESGNMAKRAAVAIRAKQPDWFVAATRSIASEAKSHGPD